MQSRGICTCNRLLSMQVGRIMNKVMTSDKTKKSRAKEHTNFPSIARVHPNIPSIGKNTSVPNRKNRRVTILNKIFMKYISDLMATGEVATQLLGRGIEISHVKVAPDFRQVNVYWFSQNDNDANELTEKILKQAAGKLQHELSQLRVIGMVPPIQFVKHKLYKSVREVELRLSQIDFGEDFVPSAFIKSQTKTPVLQMSLSPNIKAKLSKLNSNNNIGEADEIYELKIPEMRQNVMGFDHAAINHKIKSSLIKSKLAKKRIIMDIPVEPVGATNQANPDDVATFLDNKEQNAFFDDFLKKRLIEEKRRLRSKSLFEMKLQEEEEWIETKYDCDRDELNIDEDYNDKDNH